MESFEQVDIPSDDKTSTCLSIVKMTLQNMNSIMDVVLANFFELNFVLSLTHIEAVVSLITDVGYEENGDVVEQVYTLLEKILNHSKKALQDNVQVIDQLSVLSQAIKHTSVYQCIEAFTFIKFLVKSSEKYNAKEDVEHALVKIEPLSLKKLALTKANSKTASEIGDNA